MKIFYHFFRLGTIFLLFALICTTESRGQSRLTSILEKIRAELNNGNTTNALEMFQDTDDDADIFHNEELSTQETFLWDKATCFLGFSDKLMNYKQSIHYASKAREYWWNYINWFDGLSKTQKESLPKTNKRIKMAVAHLGNSIVRMCTPAQLFDDYIRIQDPGYFGVDAFDLWKAWLYALPNYKPITSEERIPSLRTRLICNDNCKEKWLEYAELLKEWARMENLGTILRKRYILEATQIITISEKCNN